MLVYALLLMCTQMVACLQCDTGPMPKPQCKCMWVLASHLLHVKIIHDHRSYGCKGAPKTHLKTTKWC
jgi:hypothetical protein